MIEDKPIDYKTEYNKTINKLVSLRQKHDGLKEDHDYIKSLADRYFDERIKLKKENEQLNHFIQELTTKGTGRIGLADGYSYSVSAVLTNWKGDFE